MNLSQGSAAPLEKPSRWAVLGSSGLILLAGLAAYAGSFSGPLVFDDVGSIADNPTIRHLWPIGPVLSPPAGGLTVSGRPVLNFTLALNHALGGTRVWGYHAGNLAIHLLAGLTLFGIARRTLRSRPGLALAIGLLWTVHPLQTESVTYLIQRAESLMSLFYLLTLYGFIRYAGSQPRAGRGWAGLSLVSCCLLGMATKEVMVSAPVVVFLYDRTFLSGTFRAAWQRRRAYYLGLAATWILLAGLVIGAGEGAAAPRGLGAGDFLGGPFLPDAWFEAVARYLRLAVWPHPLVFEYGTFWVKDAGQVVALAALDPGAR